MDKKIGIIDLGSNSVRLVIYEIKANGSFRLIDDISDTIRLSENMIDGNRLNDLAMRRAVKTVKLFRKLCTAYGILLKDIIAVATAAVRKAENRDYFLKLLLSAAGLNFRLLSGEDEALYVYKAVIHTLDIESGIITDIGGGSTEIIKFENRDIIGYTSIPLGAVVATEEHLDKDIIPSEKLTRFERYFESLLSVHEWLKPGQNDVVIGLGGTIRNLAKIHKRRTSYPLGMTHNYNISIEDFFNIYDSLKAIGLDARSNIDGLAPKRADIIVGGLAILKVLVSYVGASGLLISGNGLREGILLEYVFSNKSSRRFSDILNFSLENYLDLYGVRREHAVHISSLALQLFDQLQSLHMLGENERRLLKIASLLHDVGISISFYEHYMHSFYIIINSRINGLSHREIVLVAAIAASHSSDKFRGDWEKKYKSIMLPGDGKIYRYLSMFLKLAECLDRSETSIIKSIECQITREMIKINTFADGEAELEVSLANENSEGFRKLFKRGLIVK